jgi:hypothetical protein
VLYVVQQMALVLICRLHWHHVVWNIHLILTTTCRLKVQGLTHGLPYHLSIACCYFAAICACKTSPVTIKDVIKAAPELGAELAECMAALM